MMAVEPTTATGKRRLAGQHRRQDELRERERRDADADQREEAAPAGDEHHEQGEDDRESRQREPAPEVEELERRRLAGRLDADHPDVVADLDAGAVAARVEVEDGPVTVGRGGHLAQLPGSEGCWSGPSPPELQSNGWTRTTVPSTVLTPLPAYGFWPRGTSSGSGQRATMPAIAAAAMPSTTSVNRNRSTGRGRGSSSSMPECEWPTATSLPRLWASATLEPRVSRSSHDR